MEAFVRHELDRMKQQHFVEKVHLLEALEEQFGEGVLDTAYRVLSEDVRKEWRVIGELQSGQNPKELVDILWEHIHKSAGFEFTTTERDGGVQVHCTKCPLADMARAIGAEKWGYLLYCSMDHVIAESYNPDFQLNRTQTLMMGASSCDHYYYNKKTK